MRESDSPFYERKKENVSPNLRSKPARSPRISTNSILNELDKFDFPDSPNSETSEQSQMRNKSKDAEDANLSQGKRKRKDDDGSRRKKSSNGAAEEEVIELVEDSGDDEEAAATSNNGRRTTRSSSTLSDQFKLCEYPKNAKDSVTVCVTDYKSLEHDTFLNDIIIDFYLTWLIHEKLPSEDRAGVHVFSTMFYKRLTLQHKTNEDSSLNSAEKKHSRVKGWTKNLNLFEKNLIIFPICEHSHWYLVIAVRPHLVTLPLDGDDREQQGEPLFIVLDSLGGNKSAAVTNIRHYLAQEWRLKESSKNPDVDCPDFSSKMMKTIRPKKPEQENFSDCGIYLLHYVEKIFQRYLLVVIIVLLEFHLF